MSNFSLGEGQKRSAVVFNYSELTKDERLATLENEKKLDELYRKYQPEIGEILYNQQKVLANHDEGAFQRWYESKGFKRWKVYDYINKYQYVFRNSEDPEKIDIFENVSTSLQSEMAKPSANPTVNQAVYDGDIKTHKEYKELERQLKAKDQQINNLADVVTELSNKQPEVIEKEIVVEKLPADYHELKSSNTALLQELNSVSGDYQKSEKLINDINAENEKLKSEQERLKQALQSKRQMENDELEQAQLKRLQRDADINVHKLILNLNEFVKEQAVTVYDSQAIAGASPETKQKLSECVRRVENLLKDIKQEIGGEVAWVIN